MSIDGFKDMARRVMDLTSHRAANAELLDGFWKASRELGADDAAAIVRGHENWRSALRVLTRSGDWNRPGEVLMPGAMVAGDGGRDEAVAVDMRFHEPDRELLGNLGVRDHPYAGWDLGWVGTVGPDSRWVEQEFLDYQEYREEEYRRLSLPHSPQADSLAFTDYTVVGPLGVLRDLSEEAAVAYTEALLSIDECFERWVMWHTAISPTYRGKFPKMKR